MGEALSEAVYHSTGKDAPTAQSDLGFRPVGTTMVFCGSGAILCSNRRIYLPQTLYRNIFGCIVSYHRLLSSINLKLRWWYTEIAKLYYYLCLVIIYLSIKHFTRFCVKN